MIVILILAFAIAAVELVVIIVMNAGSASRKAEIKARNDELARSHDFEARQRDQVASLKNKLVTMEREHQERARIFMVLLELARTLGGSLDQDKLPVLLLRIAQQLFDAEELAYFRLSESGQELRVAAYTGIDAAAAKALTVKLGEGYIGHTAFKRVMMTQEDFQTESNLIKQKIDSSREKGIAPVYCVPLLQREVLLGVISIGRIAKRTKDDRDLLLIFQSLGSMALDNARLFDQLYTKDRLTGLFNRRFFEERAIAEVNRAKRFGHRISFAILSIDNFRAFADSSGTAAAEKAVARIGAMLLEHVRKIDLSCRLDESRFAVVLLETEKFQALQFAEKIKKLIDADPGVHDNEFASIRITLSLAVMTFPDDVISVHQMMDRALKHLAEAEAKGGGIILSEFGND